MTKKLTGMLFLMVVWVLTASNAAGDTIYYSHPYDTDSPGTFASYYREGSAGHTVHHQSYTDYYWDSSFAITDFHWWGSPGLDNSEVEGFVFQIYDQAAGDTMPGNLLYEQYEAGDANANFVDTNYASCVDSSCEGFDVYSYSLDLSTSFTPSATDFYWFSVYAIVDTSNWHWVLGDGDPFQYDMQLAYATDWYRIKDTLGELPVVDGFAFEITGTPIPEPASMLLLGIGLVGLVGSRIKRKKPSGSLTGISERGDF